MVVIFEILILIIIIGIYFFFQKKERLPFDQDDPFLSEISNFQFRFIESLINGLFSWGLYLIIKYLIL